MNLNITAPKEKPKYVKPYVPPPPIDVEGEIEVVSITRAGLIQLKVVCDNETAWLASQLNPSSLKAKLIT